MSKVDSIKFRMYNTGSVGDCLLLLFQSGTKTTFKMMIDCGGWKAPEKEINNCMADIKRECKGSIDLLVITHQHEDHLSGFNQARKHLEGSTGLKFKNIWMSWVENENDPVAKILKDHCVKKLKALRDKTSRSLDKVNKLTASKNDYKGAAKRLEKTKAHLELTLSAIDFELGITKKAEDSALPSRTIADAMSFVKSLKKPDYKDPGEIIDDLAGTDGIRFYILGPPKEKDPDQKILKNNEDDDEMYHLSVSPDNLSLSASAKRLFSTGSTLKEGVSPFHKHYLLDGTDKKDAWHTYTTDAEYAWRQIEEEADTSALALTGLISKMVNNTSLAIAIEFKESGKIILLPADAQSGNWISWHDEALQKKFKAKGGRSVNELLADTVFYKVGHHGSHNGTASHSGLEKMTSKNLVAFMPLVENKVPAGWQHDGNFPAKALYSTLIQKTKGRLLRTDEGWAKAATAVKLRNSLPAAEAKLFDEPTGVKDLYHEYLIKK